MRLKISLFARKTLKAIPFEDRKNFDDETDKEDVIAMQKKRLGTSHVANKSANNWYGYNLA